MRITAEIPVKFSSIGGLTNDELLKFCVENDHLRIERDSAGNILIMTPVHSRTGKHNFNLATELGIWNKKFQKGEFYDSSAGFILPNSAMRSPDISFILKANISKLSDKDKEGFYKICPDFVVELKSSSDSLKTLQQKMKEYISNGCSLGWLIDANNEKVFIYDKDGAVSTHNDFSKPLKGKYFMGDLAIVLKNVFK